MYKYILYIYKELFFVLILNGCRSTPGKSVFFFFKKNSYLLNAVLTRSFLIFTEQRWEVLLLSGKMV